MQVTLQDRERLNLAGPGLEDIMDTMVASIQGGWDIDHLHNGHHGVVQAVSVYSEQGYTERGRVRPLGEWTPSNNLSMSASGAMTWTGGDQSLRYMIFGKTLVLNGFVRNTTVGGTPDTELRLSLPLGVKCKSDFCGAYAYSDAGGGLGGTDTGVWISSATSLYIAFYTRTGAVWTAGAGATWIFFQAMIEISQDTI